MKEDLKERVSELEKRLDIIEGKERKRKIWGIIKACIKLAILILIIVLIWKLYNYVSTTIKPIIDPLTNATKEVSNWDFSKISNWIESIK